MAIKLDSVFARAIPSNAVKADGSLTSPRSYGVYRLPSNHGSTRRYRIGNHPVRQRELEQEYGKAELVYLFLSREDAHQASRSLNGHSD